MKHTIRHISLDVKGALMNWDRKMLKNMASSITVDGTPLKTADDVKFFLLDQLAQGHELLPMADCEGFDWKTGCPGHVEETHDAD